MYKLGHFGKFTAMRSWKGRHIRIGTYDTAIEAAVAYAKHKEENVVMEVEVEVKEAEGYKLHLATRSDSTTGYLGVSKMASGKFQAMVR